MTLIDRVAECHDWTQRDFVPLLIDSDRAGWVRRDNAERLTAFTDVFDVAPNAVTLSTSLDTVEARTSALDDVADTLVSEGRLMGLAHERYDVAPTFGARAWLELDRAALPFFGARAYGVHMNGFVRRADGLHVWVAKRSSGKTTFPGQLDNLVAGGQPRELGVRENLAKECAEEADIDAALAARAVPCGALSYRVDAHHGMRDDTLFLFDLELPETFVPRNTDGEVESFTLRHIDEVRAIVAETRDYKFNCNLVVIDFMIRHGVITPDEPDYVPLLEALHPSFDR